MPSKLANLLADFETQLATKLAVAATSCQLQSATDDDGVALPNGDYYLTLDRDSSQKEHILATLTTSAGVYTLSAIKTVSRQGVQVSGALREHRVGSSVVITDFAHILYMNDLLKGTTNFNSTAKLGYDGDPGMVSGDLDKFATIRYANALAIAGAPDAGITVKGIAEEATQAEIDADTGAGATSGRLFVNPSTLVLSKYGLQLPTDGQKLALTSTSGTPGSTNKYATENDTSNAATITATTISFTASTKVIADSASGFVTANLRAGDSVIVTGTVSNNGTYTIVSVAAGSIVVVESLVDESAGSSFTLTAVTINKLARYSASSQLKVPTTPVATNDASSKSYVDAQILAGVVIPNQQIPYYAGTNILESTGMQITTSADGSEMFISKGSAGATQIITIARFVKNTLTGQYQHTHTATFDNATGATVAHSVVVQGSYVYLFTRTAGVRFVRRYDKANLANVTTITISGTGFGSGDASFSDGTDLYVSETTNQFRRYSISGTTITSVSVITYTSSGDSSSGGAISNGTHVWIIEDNTADYTIRKYLVAGGAVVASSTGSQFIASYPNDSLRRLFLYKSGVLGFAISQTLETNLAVTGVALNLTYITAP